MTAKLAVKAKDGWELDGPSNITQGELSWSLEDGTGELPGSNHKAKSNGIYTFGQASLETVELHGLLKKPGTGTGTTRAQYWAEFVSMNFYIKSTAPEEKQDELVILYGTDATFESYEKDINVSSTWTVTATDAGGNIPPISNPTPSITLGKVGADGTPMKAGKYSVKAEKNGRNSTMTLIIVRVELIQVNFFNNHTIIEDDSSGGYTAPHWQDSSSPLDGDADDAGDRKFPVCYTKNTKIRVSAEFKIVPQIDLKIKGSGTSTNGGALDFPEKSLSAGSSIYTETESDSNLPDNVAFLNPLDIKWKIFIDDIATWIDVAESQNRVYVTNSAPDASTLFETLLDIGCRNAEGESTPDGIVGKIWTDFADRNVVRKEKDGYNVNDRVQMKYWNPANTTPQLLPDMLADNGGNGSCYAWSLLFIETLKAQKISSDLYELTANQSVNPGANGFLVKKWNFGKHIRTGPDGICNTDKAVDDIQIISKGNGVPDIVAITAGINVISVPGGDDQKVNNTITTGTDGICNTTKSGNDMQIIPTGTGKPDAIAITAGVNGNLDTDPSGGDDQKVGDTITTGANGKCETSISGNDVQVIPLNQGQPDTICITPGANGILDSSKVGDDTEGDGQVGGQYPYILYKGQWGGTGGEYGEIKGDAANQPGIKGQGNDEPPEYFGNHFIVKYNGKFYDPSYGGDHRNSEIEHENAAIDGIKAKVYGVDVSKRNEAVQEIEYNLIR